MKYEPQYLELELDLPMIPVRNKVEQKKEERGFVVVIGEDDPASEPVFPRPGRGQGGDWI